MDSWKLTFVLSGGRLILDESLRILEVASEFCHEFVCQPETIIGQRLENLFSPKDRQGKFAFYDRCSRNLEGFLDITIAISINQIDYMTRLRMAKQGNHWLASEELAAVQDLEIAGYMEPAAEVGGDYYDVLCHEGVVTIGIGDVTGHGLESGLLMLMAQTAVRNRSY